MPGTILIIDAVATNRIMLRVQLTSAYYHVVQAEELGGVTDIIRRTRPDLILCSMNLPDGNAIDLRALLAAQEQPATIPVVALTDQNNRHIRLSALAAGIDDVLCYPVDDLVLQARIRSLIRSYSDTRELQQEGSSPAPGFSEAAHAFLPTAKPCEPGATVAIVTRNPATATHWRADLQEQVDYAVQIHPLDDAQALMSRPAPDAVILEIGDVAGDPAFRLLADLRARAATRQSVVIAVSGPTAPLHAAEALDRGAHDAMREGFCVDELVLRLRTQLRLKARGDLIRNQVRDGLKAAVTDPMTGLYNRRFALPWLARMSQLALADRRSFAVLLADLDHFKSINDRFGHLAGDAVLTETANRLRTVLGAGDLAARVGGEEFMIALSGISATGLRQAAERLRCAVNRHPFKIPGHPTPVRVTVSIGGTLGPLSDIARDEQPEMLIGLADRALYAAKHAGRDRVTLSLSQAA